MNLPVALVVCTGVWVVCTGMVASAQGRRTGEQHPASAASTPLAREMLKAHNRVRSDLRLPPLVWSDKLAGIAEDWAVRLINANRFEHRSGSSFGENLYRIDGAYANPGDVVEAWASEARDYDQQTNTCRSRCGHYTQIIWQNTKAVGCGVARRSGREVWVCNYDPPGNVVGERPFP